MKDGLGSPQPPEFTKSKCEPNIKTYHFLAINMSWEQSKLFGISRFRVKNKLKHLKTPKFERQKVKHAQDQAGIVSPKYEISVSPHSKPGLEEIKEFEVRLPKPTEQKQFTRAYPMNGKLILWFCSCNFWVADPYVGKSKTSPIEYKDIKSAGMWARTPKHNVYSRFYWFIHSHFWVLIWL